jgi:enoyl-CoA hydratase/carnithine racemase
MTELVLLARDGPHVVLTLNRPDKLNALSYALVDQLLAQLDALEDDDGVRAIILTGAGPRAFSAGADIADFAPDIEAGADRAARRFVARGQALTRRIEAFPKPVIAAVNGLAYGGGCEVVEACALALAAEGAAFAKPEIRLGFPPPFGGTQRLPRHVGRKRALEMILTGEAIDARRAAALGLVNDVVPAGRVVEEALALARRITCHSDPAVSACLRAVNRGLNLPIDEALAVEAAQFTLAAGSPAAREAGRRFLQRRHPGTGEPGFAP